MAVALAWHLISIVTSNDACLNPSILLTEPVSPTSLTATRHPTADLPSSRLPLPRVAQMSQNRRPPLPLCNNLSSAPASSSPRLPRHPRHLLTPPRPLRLPQALPPKNPPPNVVVERLLRPYGSLSPLPDTTSFQSIIHRPPFPYLL